MSNQKARIRRCIVCDQPREIGITVFGQFICGECEKEIVSTDTSEPRYQYYVQRLKRLRLGQGDPLSSKAQRTIL
ncbi:MAG: sigma factor G inhibitor Gin [Alicyclobacillus herbarius]|uniref:sigma factor G inhibitor Gin n=1 Tax=Alicyclobacillus herbarius TaxID=122960 RepID=UPI00041F6BFE|nr:sigma factor G inhibitor Gin [Alicyclobacillus herbarius]MCL6633046.1 sigma factor G inhibitor Gin [Alicyclobacillus herbarius]